MTYLITGACGNLGQYVVKKFLLAGIDVIGIDLNTRDTKKVFAHLSVCAKENNRSFTVYWQNLVQEAALEKIFAHHTLSGIIHIAFIIPPFSEINPEETEAIHITAMKNLISLTEKYAPTIPFIFCSSTTVFASPIKPSQIIDIHHPVKPNSQYTKDKIACENLLQQSHLNWVILRMSVIMNPTFRPKKESMQYGLLISLDTLVEPVHVEDVATAIYNATQLANISHKILIIAGGEKNRMTYQDYIFGILQTTIANLTINDVPWQLFIGEKKDYLHWYDTKESQSLLQFQQKNFLDYRNDTKKQLCWWEKLFTFLLGKKLINKILK